MFMSTSLMLLWLQLLFYYFHFFMLFSQMPQITALHLIGLHVSDQAVVSGAAKSGWWPKPAEAVEIFLAPQPTFCMISFHSFS